MSTAQRLLRILLCGTVAVGAFLPATAAMAEPSAQDVERQLDKAHEELELVIEDFNRIGEELKVTRTAAEAVDRQLPILQARMDAARSDVARIATTAYKTGGDLSTADAMLSANSTNTFLHQMQSMDRVARVRQKEIANYVDTKNNYEKEKRRLDALVADQTTKQTSLSERKVKIESEIKRLEEQERKLKAEEAARAAAAAASNASTTPAPATSTTAPAPSGSGKGATAVRYAQAQLGKMYEWGADGPNTFDCSGLTMMAWKAAGVTLPHNAAMQYEATRKVTRSALAVGDLVYYNSLGHVAIYIGNNQVIHAPRTGKPIAVASVDMSTPYGYTRPG